MNNSADCLATFLIIQKNKNRKVFLVLFNNVLHSLSQKFIRNIDKVIETTSEHPDSDNVTEA